MKYGYKGKLLRINLTHKTVIEEIIEEEDIRLLLGGRGIAAKYYYDEIGPEIEPLSEENKIIFMTGPLTGAPVYASTKMQLATKSPLTNIYLCSNSSGNFGPNLKCSGYDGLIIEGRAQEPIYLVIKNNEIRFESAKELWGLKTTEVEKMLKEANEPGFSVMSIGPGGEKLVKYACIQVDDRSFGRGGAGAVMAFKNLKAIAIKGTGKIELANEEKLKEYIKKNMKSVRESKAGHNQYGTAQYTEVINNLGCYPTNNFQDAVFANAEAIYATTMARKYKVKNSACYRCPIACGQVCEVKDGLFKGTKSDPEFETIGAFGGQCGVRDFGAIIAANMLCDEYGIDTMQTGTVIAYAMELYEKGIITKDDTGGIELSFGNAKSMVEMIHKIANREDIGDLLAETFFKVAEKYPETEKFMMHVKGMSFAAYEPRGFFGMGLAYGTSSRGACHNVGGWTIRDELTSGKYDRFALAGKGKLVKDIQDTRAYVDSLGICTVVRSGMGFTDNPSGNVLEYVSGIDCTLELMNIGERIYTLERLILSREGIHRKDDLLPGRTMTEEVPSGMAKGKVLTKEMYDVMLDEYYTLRGWSQDGVPMRATIEKLGLESIVELEAYAEGKMRICI
ncbi:MAG: aldehyde ferredoxin oxidoreductase family protein [Alkaliphilus sp.]|nr:aldehyde ferredoxin oxidoreductase family protein [Alkaliphilus sp.]